MRTCFLCLNKTYVSVTIKLAICLPPLCNSSTSSSIVWLWLANHDGQALDVIAALAQSLFKKIAMLRFGTKPGNKAFVYYQNLIT